jgi:signal transduction histidine kinase
LIQEQLRQHAAQLELTVSERTAKLRETVHELEAFSYSIAHDMRAPLRAMQGFANMLQEEYAQELEGEGCEYLRRISASAHRLDRLIQDVLDYSKIVRAELPVEQVETENFLRDIIQSYPNLQPPEAEITLATPLPSVRANPAALTQVVSNLLGNAVKFVQPGVKPRVRIWAERARSGDEQRYVRLWFEDNGIGIRKEAQERIFSMFQRLNPPGQYEGTGIGLTIVRKAVERMGGKVGVESEANQGSRFWIELQEGT